MKEYAVRTIMSDDYLYRGMLYKDIEKIVKQRLANELAHALIEADFEGLTVSRDKDSSPFMRPGTLYEVRLHLATKDEAVEYEKMKKLFKDFGGLLK